MLLGSRALIASLVVVVACGGSSSPSQTPTPPSPPATPDASSPPDAAVAASADAAPAAPAASVLPTQVPITLVDDRPLVDATVNGAQLKLVLLSWGWLGLDPSIAERIGKVTKAPNGRPSAERMSVTLGSLTDPGSPPVLLPFGAIRDAFGFPQLDGALGLQLFGADKVWTIDYANKRVDVAAASTFDYRGSGHTLTYDDPGHAQQLVHVTIDGVPLTLLVDLGNRSFIDVFGSAATAKKLDTKYRKQVSAITNVGFGPPTPATLVRPTKIVVGDLSFDRQVVFLEKPTPGDEAPFDGFLGTYFFTSFERVIFDPSHHRIILEGTPKPVNHTDRSGMWFVPAPEGLEIKEVVAHGPAAAAKLAVGDKIVSFDGKPVTAADALEVRRELASSARTKATLQVKSGDKTRTVVLKTRDQL